MLQREHQFHCGLSVCGRRLSTEELGGLRDSCLNIWGSVVGPSVQDAMRPDPWTWNPAEIESLLVSREMVCLMTALWHITCSSLVSIF